MDNFINLLTPDDEADGSDGFVNLLTSDEKASGILRRGIGDPLVSAAKGLVVGLPQAAVGLADIPTLGYAGKAVDTGMKSATGLVADEGFGLKESGEFFDTLLSPEAREAQRKVSEAKGAWNTVKTALENPSFLANLTAEMLPQMYGGAALGRGAMAAAGMSTAAKGITAAERIRRGILAAGIGEGAITSGQIAESIRQENESGTITAKQAALSAIAGVITGVLGVYGGKLAQKLGFEDPDLMFQSIRAEGGEKGAKAVAKKIIGSAVSEGVLQELPQSMQEQMAQNWATGKPIMEGVPEAGGIGAVAGAVMGGGATVFGYIKPQPRIAEILKRDPIVNDLETQLSEADPEGLTSVPAEAWDTSRVPVRQASPEPPPAVVTPVRPATETNVATATLTPEEVALQNMQRGNVAADEGKVKQAAAQNILEETAKTAVAQKGYASEAEALMSIQAKRLDPKDFNINKSGNRWTITPKSIYEGLEETEDTATPLRTEGKQIWEMSATSKEYADLQMGELDRAAFGFAREDIKTITPDQVNVKYVADMENPIAEQKASGLSPEEWAKAIDLSEPIQLSYKDGKFWIEDGHHRYYAAKILGKELNVDDVDIKDKPHKTIVEKALAEGKPVPGNVLASYPELKAKSATPTATVPAKETPSVAPTSDISPEGIQGQGSKTDTKAQMNKFWDDYGKNLQMEEAGRSSLQDIESEDLSPQDIAKQFWDETYFNLPADIQRKFAAQYKIFSGGIGLNEIVPEEISAQLDMPIRADELEGTERGFTVLMHEANKRFSKTTKQGETNESGYGVVPRTAQEAVEGVGKESELAREASVQRTSPRRADALKVGEGANGAEVTPPARTYKDGAKAEGNVWARDTEAKDNSDRTLMVQFSPELMGGQNLQDKSVGYYDELYSGKREGYGREKDFWEVPQWMAFVKHIQPNADVYIVRSMAEARDFLARAGYGRMAFSAMDMNKALIKQLSKGFSGQVDISGYVNKSEFTDLDNAAFHDTLDDYAKAVGREYTPGYVDYGYFVGTKSIPRLTLSQGCKYKCAFCTVEKSVVETSKEAVDQQADEIARLGTKLVYLNDKTFGQAGNYQYLSKLYAKIKSINPEFEGFIVQTTARDFIKFDDKWLAKSGIKYVELGVESYNDFILKKLHKPASESTIDEAAKKLRKNKIALIPNIIIGMPEETRETYQRTLDFLRRNMDIVSHINIYNLALYEGTELSKKIGAKTEADVNENVLEKSFHKEKGTHEAFAKEAYRQGSKALNKLTVFDKTKRQQALPGFMTGGKGNATKESVQMVADNLMRGLKNVSRALVHTNVKDVNMPVDALDAMYRANGIDENGNSDVAGMVWDGQIYLFSDNISSELDVIRTIVKHEMFHKGFQTLFKNLASKNGAFIPYLTQVNTLLDNIWTQREADVRKNTAKNQDQLKIDSKDSVERTKARRKAAEEWLAHQAPESEPKLFDRLVSIVRNFLRQIGIERIGIEVKLSDEEIRTIIADSYAALRGDIPSGIKNAKPVFAFGEKKAVDKVARAIKNPKPTETWAEILNIAKKMNVDISKLTPEKRMEIEEVLSRVPTPEELAAAAWVGRAGQWWYTDDGKFFKEQLGDDAERFFGVMAACSPQSDAETENIKHGINAWEAFYNLRKKLGREPNEVEITDLVSNMKLGMEVRNKGVLNALLGQRLGKEDKTIKTRFFQNAWMGIELGAVLDIWHGRQMGLLKFAKEDDKIKLGQDFTDETIQAVMVDRMNRAAAIVGMGNQQSASQASQWTAIKAIWDSIVLPAQDSTSRQFTFQNALDSITNKDVAMSGNLTTGIANYITQMHPIVKQFENVGISREALNTLKPAWRLLSERGLDPNEKVYKTAPPEIQKQLQKLGKRLEDAKTKMASLTAQNAYEKRGGAGLSVTLEAVHGPLASLPLNTRMKMHKDIRSSVLTNDKIEILARKFGLKLLSVVDGMGLWKNPENGVVEINPNFVPVLSIPEGKTKAGMEDRIRAFAGYLAHANRQAETGFFHPLELGGLFERNGGPVLSANLGKVATQKQAEALVNALEKEFPEGTVFTLPSTNGIYITMAKSKEGIYPHLMSEFIDGAKRAVDKSIKDAVKETRVYEKDSFKEGDTYAGRMERSDTAGSGGQTQPQLTAYERAIRSEGGLRALRDADTLRSKIDDIKEKHATQKVGKELAAERRTTDNARAERERIERNAVFPKTITFRSTKRDSLSSDAYGRGLKGAELERVEDDPILRHRIYAYPNMGKGIKAEPGLGPYMHLIDTKKLNLPLYDAIKDPLHLARKGTDENSFEHSIIDSGFAGYFNSKSGVAVFLGERTIPVEQTEDANVTPITAEPRTTAEEPSFSRASEYVDSGRQYMEAARNVWSSPKESYKYPGAIKRSFEYVFGSPEHSAHPVIRALSRVFEERNGWFNEYFLRFAEGDHPGRQHDTMAEALDSLNDDHYDSFEQIDNDMDVSGYTQDEAREYMKKNKVAPEVVEAWEAKTARFNTVMDTIIENVQEQVDEIDESASMRGTEPSYPRIAYETNAQGEPDTNSPIDLKDYLGVLREMKNYAYSPRIREPGKYVVRAEIPASGRKFMQFAKNQIAAEKLKIEKMAEGWENVEVAQSRTLPESVQAGLKEIDVLKLVGEALNKTNDAAASEAFGAQLTSEIHNIILSRGYRRHQIGRQTQLVEGYETDPRKKVFTYLTNSAAGIAKAKAAKQAMQIMTGGTREDTAEGARTVEALGEYHGTPINPAMEGRTYDAAKKYIADNLRNVEDADRAVAFVKKLATFKYLSWTLRAPLVNVTALMTTVAPSIQQYAGLGKAGMLNVMKEIGKASTQYVRVMRGERGMLTSSEQAFMDEVNRRQYDDPQMVRDMMTSMQGSSGRTFDNIVQWGMKPFSYVEQWMRGLTMLAGYRVAKQGGMAELDAREAAIQSANNAHGVYGKATRQYWAQGTDPAARIGQVASTFLKFPQNYLNLLYDLGYTKGNIKAFTWALAAPIVLGGLAAIPFKDNIVWMINALLKGLGDDRDIEKMVFDDARKYLGPEAEKNLRTGLMGWAGIDITGSLAMNIGLPTDLLSLTGIFGAMAKETYRAGHFVATQQYSKALETVLPSLPANALRAFREMDGATTMSGKRVWNEDGTPYIPTSGETALRVAGFRGSKRTTTQQRDWETNREKQRWDESKGKIYDRYRAFLADKNPSPDRFKSIMEDVYKYNKAIVARGRIGMVVPIKPAQLKRITRDMLRQSKTELRMQKVGR